MTGPKISGAPDPGEIGEVDDELGEAMIRRGYAVSVESLSARLRDVAEPEEFTSEWHELDPEAFHRLDPADFIDVKPAEAADEEPPKPKAAAKKKAAPKTTPSD